MFFPSPFCLFSVESVSLWMGSVVKEAQLRLLLQNPEALLTGLDLEEEELEQTYALALQETKRNDSMAKEKDKKEKVKKTAATAVTEPAAVAAAAGSSSSSSSPSIHGWICEEHIHHIPLICMPYTGTSPDKMVAMNHFVAPASIKACTKARIWNPMRI